VRLKPPRGLFVAKGLIPGVRASDGDGLVRGRGVGRVQAEKARSRRRLGARTRGQAAEDADLRAYGVGVFDRNAGLSELDGYTSPR
jgi:hypothetical protein